MPAAGPLPQEQRGPRRAARGSAIGRLGEDLAATHMERLGFSIVARNVRTRSGEIDLIAFDGRALVFAEIKTRRVGARQTIGPDQEPLARLGRRQRARLRRLAAAWLRGPRQGRPHADAIRFDAIGVIIDGAGRLRRLDHVKDAW